MHNRREMAAAMPQHSLGLDEAAERAARRVLADGCRAGGMHQAGMRLVGTEATSDAAAAAVH